MLHTRKKVTVVVPCYNECEAIAKVIRAFPKRALKQLHWKLHIIVVDNNSNDNTGAIALRYGADVIVEPRKGKGHALLTGLKNVPDDTDYVLMLDGDNTYHPREIFRMIEPLDSKFCDVVLGSRIQGRIHDGSMSQMSRMGNWLFSFMVRYFYHTNVTDVLTGYFAWKKSALDKMLPHIESSGFEIEMDMLTKMAKLDLEIFSVPISYHSRMGDSKLNHLADGFKIFIKFLENLSWQPPSVVVRQSRMSKSYQRFSPERA